MRWKYEILLLISAASSILAAEASQLRGVSPDFAKFYKATNEFTCISNPSIKILSSSINDDFCDCPDGSDEPGTSACSYLTPLSPTLPGITLVEHVNDTLALPGFYCINKGHEPNYVPFLAVNDGVCDYDLCCDGSDEWDHVGGLVCENKCKTIGREWKKQTEQRWKSLDAAGKKRKELVAGASRLRKEVEDRIESLRLTIRGSEIKLKETEDALAEVKKQDRGRFVKTPGKESRVKVLANLAKGRIEELRSSLTRVRDERDHGVDRIIELENILSTFKDEYNPNFNDEGVKRAVRSWEEYVARDHPADSDAAQDRDLDELLKPDTETGAIRWDELESTEDADSDFIYKFEQYLPKSSRGWANRKLKSLRVLLIENGLIAPAQDSGSESKAVTDARSQVKAAQDRLNESKNSLNSHQEDIDKDYGPNDVFRALKGQCVSKDSGEYIYEMCWLDRTKQKPKKSGGETGMGNFARIDSITVDDDVPADGKGLGSGKRIALRYENGQHCWNGPSRSTLVVLACAEENEIWKIVEEEKCVYRMEVGTPAVCQPGDGTGVIKDEL